MPAIKTIFLKRGGEYLACAIAGLLVGISVMKLAESPAQSYSEVRANSSSYQFTNPLLECDLGQQYISEGEDGPLRSDIANLIQQQVDAGKVSDVSFYYRDLNNGPWIGIGLTQKFFPASLMKVPLMMALYKKSENEPGTLDKVLTAITTEQSLNLVQHFKPQQTVQASSSYTVSALIDSMIRYSDNTAAFTLVAFDSQAIDNMLSDLNIELPQNSTDDYLTLKDYSTFFRVLYNASYLNRKDSEAALKLLSQTTFDQGLTKYLPSDLVVSHKFGERASDSTTMQDEVHDCGIVYYPQRPYLLCVMTRGDDMDKMADTIGLISKAVYDSFTNSGSGN